MPEIPKNYAGWAAVVGVLGLFLCYVGQLNHADHDMFHEMSLFREALQLGWMPREDLFAYTPTVSPSIHHEWGTGAVLYMLTVAGGLGAAGVILLKYALTAAVLVGCFLCVRRRGVELSTFAVLSLIVLPLGWIGFTTIRAQLFTLVLLVCLMGFLEQDRRGGRWWILAWLPLYVVWLNMHAGFVAGAGLFGFYTLERFARELAEHRRFGAALGRVWHLVAAGWLMVPLLWANPYGTDYIVYLWHGIRMERSLIPEWRPLWETWSPTLALSAYAFSLGVAAYAIRRRGVRELPGLLLVAVTAWLALRHIRHGSIYAVVWLCYVPAWIQPTGLAAGIRRFLESHPRLVTGVGAACACLGLSVVIGERSWELTFPTRGDRPGLVYPVGAVNYLARHDFSGNLMVPFNAGSYVTWKLHPAVKVSIDGRYEVAYPPGALEENCDFYKGRAGWEQTLTRYPTDAVLVQRTKPVEALMEQAARDWKRVYRDEGYSLFVRADLASQFEPLDNTGTRLLARFP